jgi:PST family polysaccharide transporter
MKISFRHPVIRNALALYWVQIAEYALPMLTVPYLARILRPDGWGLVLYAQSFAGWLGILLEYGFGFSATREIARHREEPARIAQVVEEVISATLMLLAGSAGVAMIALWSVPVFQRHPDYLWLGFLTVIVQGFRPIWYFQGIERMTVLAAVNLTARVVFTLGTFVWVRTSDSGWKVLVLQALGGAIATVITLRMMFRDVPLERLSLRGGWSGLKMGWHLFLLRSSISLYTLANTFIVGLFVPPAQVAFYAGAERISNPARGLLQPISQALYPRMSHLASHDPKKARWAAWLGLQIIGGLGLLAGAGLYIFSPLIIRILLGRGYGPAVPVLQVLSLLMPLIALSNVMGIQWMLPMGMDKALNRVILGAGLLNCTMALLLAPRYGPMGMAWSVVCAELFVTAGSAFVLVRSDHGFWGSKTHEESA